MDKVKKYWQAIVKEREDFWSSLFKKYEDPTEKDVDVSSYMDNSSRRIDNLLKLAADEELEEKNPSDPLVSKFFEEQNGETSNSSSTTREKSTTPNHSLQPEIVPKLGNQKETSSKNDLELILKKKITPTFIAEIEAEDDTAIKFKICNSVERKLRLYGSQFKDSGNESGQESEDHCQSQLSTPQRKLKLFEPQSQLKDSGNESGQEEGYFEQQNKTLSESLSKDSLNESNLSSASFDGDSIKFVCRRVKSRSKQMPAPKRLRLL